MENRNKYLATWYLVTLLCCVFSFSMLLLVQGFEIIFYIFTGVVASLQIFGLTYYLQSNAEKRSKRIKTILRLNFLASFSAIFCVVFFSAMMFSQFHSKLPADAKGNIDDINIQEVINKKGTYIFQTEDFYIIFPEYQSVEFITKDRPKKSDGSITFCGAAAFSLDYSLAYDEQKVCGDYAHNGKLTNSYHIQNLGAFTFYEGKGHLITEGNPDEAIKEAALKGGDGFEQLVAMHNGKGTELQIGETRCLRVLTEIQGRLCLIDSIGMVSYEDFIQDLEKAGIENALYLEMGAGWNYCWYRLENNHTKNVFGLPFPFSHNWIIFKK